MLALCVFVLTFGQIQVNATGRSTVDGPGRDGATMSARRTSDSIEVESHSPAVGAGRLVEDIGIETLGGVLLRCSSAEEPCLAR